jgi:hypothetical protein
VERQRLQAHRDRVQCIFCNILGARSGRQAGPGRKSCAGPKGLLRRTRRGVRWRTTRPQLLLSTHRIAIHVYILLVRCKARAWFGCSHHVRDSKAWAAMRHRLGAYGVVAAVVLATTFMSRGSAPSQKAPDDWRAAAQAAAAGPPAALRGRVEVAWKEVPAPDVELKPSSFEVRRLCSSSRPPRSLLCALLGSKNAAARPPPTAAHRRPPDLQCTDDDRVHQSCMFYNLILYRGDLTYLVKGRPGRRQLLAPCPPPPGSRPRPHNNTQPPRRRRPQTPAPRPSCSCRTPRSSRWATPPPTASPSHPS